MGLTVSSTGAGTQNTLLSIRKRTPQDKVIALAGNPNVGKSTVFNALTGMHQHTGNWPGKTVANAQGYCQYKQQGYVLVDIPGTYSLCALSAEEEVARDFLCFGRGDAAIVVCDATCLERNLNLVLQILEITPRVLVCVNLLDEAKKKKVSVNLQALEQTLGVPVVGTSARSGKGLRTLLARLDAMLQSPAAQPVSTVYPQPVREALDLLCPPLVQALQGRLSARFVALKLLEQDESLLRSMEKELGEAITQRPEVAVALAKAHALLAKAGYTSLSLRDAVVAALYHKAQQIAAACVSAQDPGKNARQYRIDRILTGKWSGLPLMLLLLAGVFYLTMVGANALSALLSNALFGLQDSLSHLFFSLGAPDWLHGALVLGMYRVLAWVVSVMLPPMAIFFPLFTLLEDVGYLPRVAFSLDHPFQRCRACGKQALTMCMGLGCNAAGVVGCRIIDSPRERLIATVTNSLVPCNGRFPMILSLLSMFFAGSAILSALGLTAVLIWGVLMTFLSSRLLSATLLKGVPSSFTLELPPYRRPQVGKVLVRSVLDRTLFVLGRAAAVAAPAGLLIWILANVTVGGTSLLGHCTAFWDPFARLFGMDGVIFTAFLLGLPANEIVIPIMVMAYMAEGSLAEAESLATLKDLLTANGWTWVTALCTLLFSLMHWPCSTTLLTIKKETQSTKWMWISALLPTVLGLLCCFLVAGTARLLGL